VVEKSILLVDDNPASRIYLANFLKVKEFKVLEAQTGKEGLIAAWQNAPDLVLFDPVLADISDREFIQKLRNDPRTSTIPLVALSSDPAPARKQTCLNVGVDEYLVKSSQAILSLEEILKQRFRVENPTDNKSTDGERDGSLIVFLVVSTDQSTIKLTKTVWDYLQTQGVVNQKIYAILNRAVGLEGLTKTQAEEIIGLLIKTTMPYMGSNFALANNLNQPITKKYPTDTASIIFKETAEDMVKLVQRLRRSK